MHCICTILEATTIYIFRDITICMVEIGFFRKVAQSYNGLFDSTRFQRNMSVNNFKLKYKALLLSNQQKNCYLIFNCFIIVHSTHMGNVCQLADVCWPSPVIRDLLKSSVNCLYRTCDCCQYCCVSFLFLYVILIYLSLLVLSSFLLASSSYIQF